MMWKILVVQLFCRGVPPGVVVVVGDVGDALQGKFDAVVALAFVGPAQHADQFQPGELNVAPLKVALELGELDQGLGSRCRQWPWAGHIPRNLR